MSHLFCKASTVLLIVSISGIVSAGDLERISDFTLKSHRGKEWSLNEVSDAKAVVVAFLGTECPLARLYGPRLEQLNARYADRGVAFVGIIANTQDSLTEITAYVAKHGITFPMLKDLESRVADQFSAERTPEVFLLDQNRIVRYRGRVDDQYQVGIQRPKAQRHDLAVAIDEVLAGQEVSVAKTTPLGCYIGRRKKVAPRGEVTWSKDIARIFNARCVECHREQQIAPFTLTSYEDVLGWEDTILEVIDNGRMPPWYANKQHTEFRNDPRLTDKEKNLIRTWVTNGMPEGDPKHLPDPPEFADGWRMPEQPDKVFKWRGDNDEGFMVPAEGVVDYQYNIVDPGWTEDMYVVASEARPDKVGVVHHIIAYVIPPGDEEESARKRWMLVGYAPGSIPNVLGDGQAMRVEAGSKLLFELHYTPNGVAREDLSYIGLKFTDKKNVRQLVRGAAVLNRKMEVPAGQSNYPVEGRNVYKAVRDEKLLDMTPHMHLRGKAFKYWAIFPDGREELLLDVPNYDFNWQLSYELKDPLLLPKGTRIRCTGWYDNSTSNPFLTEEQAAQSVKWGEQSDEEMMIGFFTVVDADPPSAKDDSGE